MEVFEVKQMSRGLYLSSNEWQLQGHIDNLAAKFRDLIKRGYYPILHVVTTADVRFSPRIEKYANDRNVGYSHWAMNYRIVTGK